MNTQTKWLVGSVVALVIINIALVAFLWLKKDNTPALSQGPGPRDARDFFVKELSLNEQQVKTFDSLRKGHFERMKGYNEMMRQLKDRLFDQLKFQDMNDGVIDSPSLIKKTADSIAQQIGQLQTKIDLETFNHFSQLRSILIKDQTEKFDNTIQEVLRTMRPKDDPPRPGDKDHPPSPGDRPPPPDDSEH